MITATIETAIKLKAAGWTKPTELVYTNYYHGEPTDKMHIGFPAHTTDPNKRYAPTTEEILADLPMSFIIPCGQRDKIFYLSISPSSIKRYVVAYFYADDFIGSFHNDILCEALAELWLWAKENGYIKAEKAKEA